MVSHLAAQVARHTGFGDPVEPILGPMGWFLRKRALHPNLRELKALRCCITAWRRAAIEHWFLDGVASREALTERLSQLNWYNSVWDGADPFTDFVLKIPVGEMEPT